MTITLRTGDAADLFRAVPADTYDAIITSPPYDAVRDYHGAWTLDLPALGADVHRVLKPGGVACIVIADGTHDGAKTGTTALLTAAWITQTPLRIFEHLIYARPGRPGAWWATRFRVDHESILVFLKGSRRAYLDKTHLREPTKHAGARITGTTRMSDGTRQVITGDRRVADTKERGTIWRLASSNSEGGTLKQEHPATFPDALARDLVRAFVPPGGRVLDPFVGSGTTCIEAEAAGRDSEGWDIAPQFTDLARRRIEGRSFPLA